MDEQFHLGREVVVHHILEQRDVDTSCSEIGDKEHFDHFFTEPEQPVLSSPLVHGTVNVVTRDPSLRAKLAQVLDVVLGGTKDDCLLLASYLFVEDVEQNGFLLHGTRYVEMELEPVGKFGVAIDLHHAIVFHT